jgi:hypothetical protein
MLKRELSQFSKVASQFSMVHLLDPPRASTHSTGGPSSQLPMHAESSLDSLLLDAGDSASALSFGTADNASDFGDDVSEVEMMSRSAEPSPTVGGSFSHTHSRGSMVQDAPPPLRIEQLSPRIFRSIRRGCNIDEASFRTVFKYGDGREARPSQTKPCVARCVVCAPVLPCVCVHPLAQTHQGSQVF